MGLPQLSPGPGRQLLQAVWELASGAGRWPTFAELDRRLDSAFDLQALDVLREMPPGFLHGAGPNSQVPLLDNEEIGLTVAGVAACRNTDELLMVFIEFVQMATGIEKGWQPPVGQPDAMPGLTDAEFALHARTLPAAGREHLLQLLFLMLQAERGGWAGFTASPTAGHWAAIFNREIRVFRNVSDIDDYWSRRFKPWEGQDNSPAPAIPVSANHAVVISGSQGAQTGDAGMQVNYFIREYIDQRGDAVPGEAGILSEPADGARASEPIAPSARFAEGAQEALWLRPVLRRMEEDVRAASVALEKAKIRGSQIILSTKISQWCFSCYIVKAGVPTDRIWQDRRQQLAGLPGRQDLYESLQAAYSYIAELWGGIAQGANVYLKGRELAEMLAVFRNAERAIGKELDELG